MIAVASWIRFMGYMGALSLIIVIFAGVRIPGWAWFGAGFWLRGRRGHGHSGHGSSSSDGGGDGGGN